MKNAKGKNFNFCLFVFRADIEEETAMPCPYSQEETAVPCPYSQEETAVPCPYSQEETAVPCPYSQDMAISAPEKSTLELKNSRHFSTT